MTGINPDIARLIGDALGVDVQIEVANFDSIIPGLAAGRYDMTVSSMTPTAERMKVLNFVDYLSIGNSIAVAKGNPVGVKDEHGLCGKRVGFLTASYQLTTHVPKYNKECAGKGEKDIATYQYQDTRQAISALTSGRLDAVLADSPIMGYAATQNPQIEVITNYGVDPVGVGMPKSSGLIDAVGPAVAAVDQERGIRKGAQHVRHRKRSDHRCSRQLCSVVVPDMRKQSRSPGTVTPDAAVRGATDEATTVVPLKHNVRLAVAIVLLVVAAAVAFSVATNENYRWGVVRSYLFDDQILAGAGLTLLLTLISMTAGILLGTVLAVMRLSANPIVSTLSRGYIWFFRGTPLLVQLIFWYNIAALYPTVASVSRSAGLRSSSDQPTRSSPRSGRHYWASRSTRRRTWRKSSAAASDRWTRSDRAARALGMSSGQTDAPHRAPQAMRVVLPPTGNQVISMLKGTSLVSVLAISDLLYSAQIIYAANYQTIPLLIVASLWYLLMTTIFSFFQNKLERRYGRGFAAPTPPRAFARRREDGIMSTAWSKRGESERIRLARRS